jgi:integrase
VAVEYGHIPANPARGRRRKLKADKPRRPYLDSAHQITALLDAAGDLDREARADRQHVNRRGLIATLIFTGLRISELLALLWRDVDLAGGWLNIRDSKLTPHALRRTFASVLYAIRDDPGIVMDELGHEDAELALTVYRQSMRRDDGEKDCVKALVNGESFGSFGSDAEIEPATEPMERTA